MSCRGVDVNSVELAATNHDSGSPSSHNPSWRTDRHLAALDEARQVMVVHP
jgi:hypothetical protein